MPRKKAEPAAGPPAEQRPTRELYRFIAFYLEKVRKHSKSDTVGVFRQIQNLIDKGLGVDVIAIALENYEADEWRRKNPHFSKHIRSFFTPETIKDWQTPKKIRPVDPLDRVTQFKTDVLPPKAVPLPLDDPQSTDEL